MSLPKVTGVSLRQDLIQGREIALIDLRSEYLYAHGHPLFAVSLPYGRIEVRALDLLPRRDVTIVLYDDGEGLVERAAAVFADIGYTNVSELDDGLAGWVAGGGELFADVNAPSKAFGELVAEHRHTPMRSAREVNAAIERGDDIVILDSRRVEEFRTMSIPTGRSLPGGELIKRAASNAPDPATTIIVNCAGRTRSIIGAQSLIHAGLPNQVFALENGTIGWELAGLTLAHGASQIAQDADPAHLAEAQTAAARLAERAELPAVNAAGIAAWQQDTTRTLYLLDVRGPEEFRAGHLPGFRSAPGGQLVQATDEWVGVRHARLVLADDDGVRARVTGFWLRQLGWRDVAIADPALLQDSPGLQTGDVPARLPPLPADLPSSVTVEELASHRARYVVLDVTTSTNHKAAHIPGAYFVAPADVPDKLGDLRGKDLVVTCVTAALSPYVAARLARQGLHVHWLKAGTRAWQASGQPVETGFAPDRTLSTPNDVYKRPYEGTDNADAAKQAYLDWEFGLVEQLARDGTHGFEVF